MDRKIIVEIEISDVKNWNVDWDEEIAVRNELALLSTQLKTMMYIEMGMAMNNIQIKSELKTQSNE